MSENKIRIKAKVLRKLLLLASLYIADGLYGRTKLQKIHFFFLKKALNDKILSDPIFNYKHYHHGPYSEEIGDDIKEFENLEFIKSKVELLSLKYELFNGYRQSFFLTDLGKKAAKAAYEFLKFAAPQALKSLEDITKKCKDLTSTKLSDISHETEEFKKTKHGDPIYSVKENAIVEFPRSWEELENTNEELADEIEDLTLALDEDFVEMLNQNFEELESELFEELQK